MNYPIPFGKYLLLERVNVGGMAEVFKAKAFGVEGFERILAIKRILPNMVDDDEFINMFVDEARIAVQLSHANIVQIYELGKFEGQYYIAMEYVGGKDLRFVLDHVRKKKELLPLPASAFIVSKICEGLDYAHRKADPTGRPMNVIHRDVSPQNILVSYEGAVKITDFGIAKAEDRASKTQAGVLKGKFGYMSPEQVRGLEIDHRSDIFAVGILMYEMITGKRLFLGESDFSTLEKVRNADVPPPSSVNPDVPPELERIMLKTLARERDERYQWAAELHDDLQQFLIEGNTIYNAKRCAALLQQEFKADIDAEMQKMEEFMRVQAPENLSDGVAEMRAAPVKTDPGAAASGEKTMIFESGFSGSRGDNGHEGPARAGWGNQQATGEGRAVPHEARTGSVVVNAAPRQSLQPRPSYVGPQMREPPGLQQKHVGAIIIAVAAFVAALILLVVLLVGPAETVGTVQITSTPTQGVHLYLDGEQIGTSTPLIRNDIAVGVHTLFARAPGYADSAYRFDLVAGAPARIDIVLKPAMADGTIIVTSDPPGATIKIGGVPQGETPKTLTGQDVTKPVIIEISKDGYHPATQSVSFLANKKETELAVTLAPLTGASPRGTIRFDSKPSGASVYLDRRRVCVTPCEAKDVDTGVAHDVELDKDGFKPERGRVAFKGGETQATFDRALAEADKPKSKPRERDNDRDREKEREKEREKDKTPAPVSSGGGGKCGGTGAKLSVMTLGESDCKVTVGKVDVGVAPFLNKDVPTGKCDVKVVCASGKKLTKTLTFKAGGAEKLKIEKDQWQ